MQQFVSNIWVQLAIALILLVLGWRMTPTGANAVLLIAWAILAACVYRGPGILELDIIPRVLITGCAACIVGLAIYYTLWTKNAIAQPSANLSEIAKKSVHFDDDLSEPTTVHTFWLLRDKGSTISLGPCPGEKCMQFELGELRQDEGELTQEILLSGAGFAPKPPRKGKLSELGIPLRPGQEDAEVMIQDFNTPVRLTNSALLSMPLDGAPIAVRLGLRKGAELAMDARHANIKIAIMDLRADSLRIRLTLTPPSPTPNMGASPP
jgi:hypothetical protein